MPNEYTIKGDSAGRKCEIVITWRKITCRFEQKIILNCAKKKEEERKYIIYNIKPNTDGKKKEKL